MAVILNKVGINLNRAEREKVEENWLIIEKGLTDAEGAGKLAELAELAAEDAKSKVGNIQQQVDALAVSGDSSPQATQASVGADGTSYNGNLKARLDSEYLENQARISEKINKGEVSVFDIDKNKGKLDQSFMAPEFLQQMAGDTPVNAVPGPNSLVTSQFTKGSVTREKLGKDINLFPAYLFPAKKVVDRNAYRTATPSVNNGTLQRDIVDLGTDFSITFTPTAASNYVWLVPRFPVIELSAAEKENIGKRVTLSFVYSYVGTSGVDSKAEVFFSGYRPDGTTDSSVVAVLEKGNKKEITIEIARDYFISDRSYMYIRGIDVGAPFTFSKAEVHYGDTFSARQPTEEMAALSTSVKKNTDELGRYIPKLNRYSNSYDILQGRSSEIPLPLGTGDAINKGIVTLPVKNNGGTDKWVRFDIPAATKTSSFTQIIIDPKFLKELAKEIAAGTYENLATVSLDLYIDSPDKFELSYEILGRDAVGAWVYATPSRVTLAHDGTPKTYKVNLPILSSYYQTDLSTVQYLAVYIIFKNVTKGLTYYVNNIRNDLGDRAIEIETIPDGSIPLRKLAGDVAEGSGGAVKETKRGRRAGMGGDSVTWGGGYLSDGYLKYLDEMIRENLGQLVRSDSATLLANGDQLALTGKKFYAEKAKKVTGVGSSVKFTMDSSEVRICQAIERGNDNTELEIYIDGVLFDTFENRNDRESGTDSKSYTGDGAALNFELGRPFTFAHVVKVNGATMTGSLNAGGMGAPIPTGHDFMVVRKASVDENGEPEVVHVVQFKTAPATGAAIAIDFSYSESLAYAKTTIGELGNDFASGLESPYGDGLLAFDPSNPGSISSGLDFRHVDPASFLVYKFAEHARREIEVRVKGNRPGKTGTPYFIFNFATDLDFQYMNAGIGGFKYSNLNKEDGLTSYKKMMEYEPDFITLLLGTNDDFEKAVYPVTQKKTVNLDYLTNNSRHFFSVASKSGDNYEVFDRWVDTVKVTRYSVQLAAGLTTHTVAKGNYIIVNKWTNDERYCQTRLIHSYDAASRTVHFLTPIDTTVLPAQVQVMIKDVSGYVNEAKEVFSKMQAYNPTIPVYLAAMGVPNVNHRQLLGYREVIRDLANEKGFKFIDLFKKTSEFMAALKPDKTYTLTADGSAVYTVDGTINPLLRNARVTVGEKEIVLGKEAFISGGYGYYYNQDLGVSYELRPTRLTFVVPPPAGQAIKITGTSETWSADYCHMGKESGKFLYGEEFYKNISKEF